jgi:hypothetical protein
LSEGFSFRVVRPEAAVALGEGTERSYQQRGKTLTGDSSLRGAGVGLHLTITTRRVAGRWALRRSMPRNLVDDAGVVIRVDPATRALRQGDRAAPREKLTDAVHPSSASGPPGLEQELLSAREVE